MIAVDSSVLFDILIGDARFAEASEACVGDALARDKAEWQGRRDRLARAQGLLRERVAAL